MTPQLAAAMQSAYDELPEPIKTQLAPKEWAWLSDAEKANLIQNETEPEGGFSD